MSKLCYVAALALTILALQANPAAADPKSEYFGYIFSQTIADPQWTSEMAQCEKAYYQSYMSVFKKGWQKEIDAANSKSAAEEMKQYLQALDEPDIFRAVCVKTLALLMFEPKGVFRYMMPIPNPVRMQGGERVVKWIYPTAQMKAFREDLTDMALKTIRGKYRDSITSLSQVNDVLYPTIKQQMLEFIDYYKSDFNYFSTSEREARSIAGPHHFHREVYLGVIFLKQYAAAEQGRAQEQFYLGSMYGNGEFVEKDDQEAMKWYRKAAEQGNPGAQNNLGQMYAVGQGVPKDDQEAMKWYRKAAEQGDSGAQSNVGGMYDVGAGVPQDYQEAMKWYRKAAEQGDSGAQVNVGLMYVEGLGVPQDDVRAYMWNNIAAATNSKGVQNQRFLSKRMTAAQIEKAQELARRCQESKFRECDAPVPQQASAPEAPHTGTNAPVSEALRASPSFDCRNATTTIEKQICASPKISELDAKLAETYKELKQFVDKKELKAEQATWVKTRNRCVDTVCLERSYEERLNVLENYLIRQKRAVIGAFSQ